MPISTTYLLLCEQIADELGGRTDLLSTLFGSGLALSPIKNAVQSAIAKWEREPFYMNEVYNSASPLFTTVAGQEFYTTAANAGIASAPKITALHILVNGNRWPLIVRTWQYLDEISNNPASQGQPDDWAYFAETIRLYPIPNGAYPVRASRLQKLAALANDGDSNIWTQDAADLIRSEAKQILALEVLHDAEMAQRMRVAIYGDPSNPRDTGYLGALKAESARRAKSKIRPTDF